MGGHCHGLSAIGHGHFVVPRKTPRLVGTPGIGQTVGVGPPIVQDQLFINLTRGFLRPILIEDRRFVMPMGSVPETPHQKPIGGGVAENGGHKIF